MMFYGIVTISVILILAFVFFAIIKTSKIVKEDDIKYDIIPVEYEAPDDFNSAEVGYIYFGENNISDIISLLPYLASKGYIEISNIKFSQKKDEVDDDIIYILKKYNEKNISEKMLMEYLDRFSEPTNRRGALSEISVKRIKEDFMGIQSVIGWRIAREIGPKIFNYGIKSYVWAINIFFAVILLSVLGVSVLAGDVIACAIPFSLCAGVTAFVVVKLGFSNNKAIASINGKTIKRSWLVNVAGIILVGCSFGIIPIVVPMMTEEDQLQKWCGVALFVVGLCGGMIIVRCIEKIRRTKTGYGKKVYKQICGFREYLDKVEKRRIETLAKDDPKLCYEMMAYAYALNITKDWIDEFENGIKMQ